MTNWVEIGKSYILANGKETFKASRTPPLSVYHDRFPVAARIDGESALHFWNEEGLSYTNNKNFDLTDCADNADEPDALEEALYQSDMQFFLDVKKEIVSARAKFSNLDLAHAMTEEFGEVIKALMDQKQKGYVTSDEIYAECVQAAAMAMRLALEGDPCFPKYQPPTIG